MVIQTLFKIHIFKADYDYTLRYYQINLYVIPKYFIIFLNMIIIAQNISRIISLNFKNLRMVVIFRYCDKSISHYHETYINKYI